MSCCECRIATLEELLLMDFVVQIRYVGIKSVSRLNSGIKTYTYCTISVLSVIVDEFEFFPREDEFAVVQHTSLVVNLPYVVGEIDMGGRLPVKIRKAARPI